MPERPPTETAPTPTPASDAALQRALAEAVSAYGARVRTHGALPPFPDGDAADATDVAFTAAAMLRAAEITSFEIAAMFNV